MSHKPRPLPVRPMYPDSSLRECCTEKQAEEYRNATDMGDYWRQREAELVAERRKEGQG